MTDKSFRPDETIEADCEYKGTPMVCSESVAGTLMLNYDNRDFPAVSTETGLKTVEPTIPSTADFFGFYVADGIATNVTTFGRSRTELPFRLVGSVRGMSLK